VVTLEGPGTSPALRPPDAASPKGSNGADGSKTADSRLLMYRRMLEARLFEQRVQDLFLQNLVKGTTHLSLGQEAVAAGFGVAMREDDLTFATYRGHHHVLARGVPLGPVMAELCGRGNGLLRGKGGSMHLTSVDHGMMGSYAVVGAHLPVAVGAAWSARYRGSGQVVVCFFGDGTTNIGAFHEALNLAVVWRLPVVFVCENNLYMEYTPIESMTAVSNPAAGRAPAYGLPSLIIDGNDADEVYEAALSSLGRARGGEGPSLIEAVTYRHGGHSRADPATYRPAEEVSAWLERDPLPRYRARLAEAGVPEHRLAAMESDARAAVDQATEEAKAGPQPDPAIALTDVFADGGSSWRS
jgi:acetoin:2,6-dichlorophenolindophenol oxidoreductase subunit alpha